MLRTVLTPDFKITKIPDVDWTYENELANLLWIALTIERAIFPYEDPEDKFENLKQHMVRSLVVDARIIGEKADCLRLMEGAKLKHLYRNSAGMVPENIQPALDDYLETDRLQKEAEDPDPDDSHLLKNLPGSLWD